MALPVEGPTSHFLTPDAARQCAAEIAEAGGVEVFFIGRRNEGGLVAEVESHAFGSADCVPALTRLARPGDVLLHNHPSGNLMPSSADLNVASAMGNEGVGFYILDNAASRCRVVVKAHDPKRKVVLEEGEVLRRLSPQGDLARSLGSFEDRPQQRDMAMAVLRAFNHDGIAIIEAGTGTGKSFAYLIPAILFALRNGERIVVSTNTINLQEQLLQKDIPALQRLFGDEVEAELVKGRGNYVCKRKADYARREGPTLLADEFQRELHEVLDWAASSRTGDRGELSVPPRHEVWERVQSEADNCLRVRCPFYEECFFYNSRRRAARAKILIVNHALLMSDLSVRRATGNYTMAAVLPPWTRLIMDEGHHLEEAATKNLSQVLTRVGLRTMLGRFHRGEGGKPRGVFISMLEELDGLARRGAAADLQTARATLEDALLPRVSDVRASVDALFSAFIVAFLRLQGIYALTPREEKKIRLIPAITESTEWRSECLDPLGQLAMELQTFLQANERTLALFEDLPEPAVEPLTNPLLEWRALLGRLEGMRQTLMMFLADSAENCRWVELSQPPGAHREVVARLCIAPVDVRRLLQESLHDRVKSEVVTSATLAVDQNFDFFAERAGIPRPRPAPAKPAVDEDGLPIIEVEPAPARPLETRCLTTPFDYRRQVFFGVPTDLPDPREGAFDDALAELVNRSVAISGGRAFILFTSYGQLNRVCRICEPTIRRLGIEVLRQGDESRESLLRRFRDDETSVLFATSSFWEGVDVRGRALELLILARLPFSVPTEPVQEAQFEALKAQGRDPFDALVVPRAVIRFKQGFGRLIRARSDRGAVLLADRRVLNMPYGKRFLRSLPELDVRKGATIPLMTEMQEFFARTAPAAPPA